MKNQARSTKNEKNVDYLKLGVAGLPDAEVNLISTLFRLHRVEPSFIWKLESEPPFDALLVEASLPAEAYQSLYASRTSIMRLSSPGRLIEGEMPRPIRSDRLVAWLNSIEVGLLHGGHDGFVSTASDGRTSALPPMGTGERPTSQPAEKQVEATPINTADVALLFKLKRWPPANAMGKDIARIRLATVLSRKPISLQELTTVSRVSMHECEAFLRSLSQLNLVSIERRSDAPLDFDLLANSSIKDETKNSSTRGALSLIRSIRRRFGLI